MSHLRWTALPLLTFFSLLAQPTPEPLPVVVIAVVENISGNAIHARTSTESITIHSDARTEVWKGKTFHDLSPLKSGDDISARCRRDSSGKLIAISIWANITNFFGVIVRTTGDRFEAQMNPNADPRSAYPKGKKIVLVDSDTIFESSAKEDLMAGRGVQVIGLDLKNGSVQATRVTVYEGKRPVRMGAGEIMPRTRPRQP